MSWIPALGSFQPSLLRDMYSADACIYPGIPPGFPPFPTAQQADQIKRRPSSRWEIALNATAINTAEEQRTRGLRLGVNPAAFPRIVSQVANGCYLPRLQLSQVDRCGQLDSFPVHEHADQRKESFLQNV